MSDLWADNNPEPFSPSEAEYNLREDIIVLKERIAELESYNLGLATESANQKRVLGDIYDDCCSLEQAYEDYPAMPDLFKRFIASMKRGSKKALEVSDDCNSS